MTPRDIERLLIVGTAALCLFIIVGGGVVGLLTGLIPQSALGSTTGHSAATGLAVFLVVIAGILTAALIGGSKNG
jgi:hypothetical protein